MKQAPALRRAVAAINHSMWTFVVKQKHTHTHTKTSHPTLPQRARLRAELGAGSGSTGSRVDQTEETN